MSVDAVRAYLTTLRTEQGYTQEAVAEAAGLTRLSWVSYETGATKDIRAGTMLTVLRLLRGSFDHLRELAREDATPEDGAALARLRLEEERSGQLQALLSTLSHAELEVILRRLDQDAEELARSLPSLRSLLRPRRSDEDTPAD